MKKIKYNLKIASEWSKVRQIYFLHEEEESKL